MKMLKLKDVTYRYPGGDRDVLKDVSCLFETGRLTAVTGPSGSGKSTLLSIIAGMDKPSSGEIYLGEQKLSEIDHDKYRRESVSMIFQAFHLFPVLTVMENVCFPMELIGMRKADAKKRASELLYSVGIDDSMFKRYPSNLSGGEQQRVAIARSMASGANLLLADEPTGNLDNENMQNIMDILRRLAHENGYCVIIVTHDMDAAESADLIYKMRDGELTEKTQQSEEAV